MEQYHLKTLQYVVDAAVRAYSCLTGLREEFSEILQSHYLWLYETYGPSDTHLQSSWPVAASDAMGGLCRHQASLNHIMSASRHVARFVLHTSIQPLVIQPDWAKRDLMSTAKLLASFKGKNGKPLQNEEHLALVEFLDGHKRTNAEDVTYHAEGAGLFAHVLARVRDEVVNHDVDHETADKSLLLPRRDITDHFRKMPIPTAVNKRCSAVYDIMLAILERESGRKFLYTGAHTHWRAVSIPRWLPKKFFNALYDQVESVLRDALQRILEEQGLAHSGESGSSSDLIGGSAHFIQHMTMRDPVANPRPQNSSEKYLHRNTRTAKHRKHIPRPCDLPAAVGKVGSEDQNSGCARLPPSNSPVTDVASNDLRCNVGGATGVAGVCEVPVYLSKVADATTADGSSELFKIVESGYLTTAAGSTWGTEVLNENYERFGVMIPPGLVAGDYLLRAEAIALHAPSQPGGAQFYVTCYQIRVSGGGGATPAGVRFPGAYNESDPGIQVEVWGGGFSEDTIPGPAVVSV
ncbi:hypothetical protein CcaCcLH18_07576 [Colletotrichum camelliae]|nr:hypothetical protein CcaCcLH18_07576 [Colletotrichum camelliae]